MSQRLEMPVKLRLFGTFSVVDSRGLDLTPRSSKAQGLLALLASDPNGTRTRAWLQSKLWSDRGAAQAAGSLRQCLVQTRKALGEYADLLSATRKTVVLDLSRLEVSDHTGEFLEGLDVQDEEFETWLRFHRRETKAKNVSRVESPFKQPPERRLPEYQKLIITYATGFEITDKPTVWLSRVFADGIAQQLQETFSRHVSICPNASGDEKCWLIELSAFQCSEEEVAVRASLKDGVTGRHVWAETSSMQMRGAPPVDHPKLKLLSNRLVEVVADTLFLERADEDCPDVLCRKAIKNLFSINPDLTKEADSQFATAFDISQRGLYLAWRAQTKAIRKVEKHETDMLALCEEGQFLAERALELEPNNSMVLATVANTLGHLLKDDLRGLHLAKRSVLLNPSNPMAWWSLSSAHVYAGDTKSAYRSAKIARELALLSPHRFWWDSLLIGIPMLMGNNAEAQKFAELSHEQNRNFRPPMRYLIAFYANTGRDEEALLMAEKLRKLEEDFSIERLVRDAEYPASLLHKASDMELDRISALS